jgi:hypothetical protein
MRALKLILLGTLAALGILRGLEMLLFSGQATGAVFPLAFGVLFTALFARVWKNRDAKARSRTTATGSSS